MLKIRLQRIGRRNDPHFRVLVAEHTAGPKSNKFVEKVGTLNPKTKETHLNDDRIKYWLSVGAKPTDRVHNMLVKAGIIKSDTINVLPQKTPVVREEEETQDEPAKEEAPATDSAVEEEQTDAVEEKAEETKEEEAPIAEEADKEEEEK